MEKLRKTTCILSLVIMFIAMYIGDMPKLVLAGFIYIGFKITGLRE